MERCTFGCSSVHLQRQHLHQNDVKIHNTVAKCVSVILTLKFYLLDYIKENVSLQLYVEAGKGSTFFPKSFKLLYLEARNRQERHASQNRTSLSVVYHTIGPSVPAEDYLQPFQRQRRKDKSIVEFRLLHS
jgi:hypothetical protein